jgi:hypothetical protein
MEIIFGVFPLDNHAGNVILQERYKLYLGGKPFGKRPFLDRGDGRCNRGLLNETGCEGVTEMCVFVVTVMQL